LGEIIETLNYLPWSVKPKRADKKTWQQTEQRETHTGAESGKKRLARAAHSNLGLSRQITHAAPSSIIAAAAAAAAAVLH
jgi:hypothetical protein